MTVLENSSRQPEEILSFRSFGDSGRRYKPFCRDRLQKKYNAHVNCWLCLVITLTLLPLSKVYGIKYCKQTFMGRLIFWKSLLYIFLDFTENLLCRNIQASPEAFWEYNAIKQCWVAAADSYLCHLLLWEASKLQKLFRKGEGRRGFNCSAS